MMLVSWLTLNRAALFGQMRVNLRRIELSSRLKVE